ncbi:exodeoxyribonuclease V subunit beta [Chitinimonas sp.]|uniref:exodeoxyribonuclease V subunit beta n=1 Tax=Chitinimonas sp. TaxID=1934313 RepID=UPI002F942B5D
MSAARVFDPLGAPLDALNLIEASAGTGKTWTIAALYARLVLEKRLKPEDILVVTYTKAATAELRGRIRTRVAQLADAFERGESQDPFDAELLAATPPEQVFEAARHLRAAVSGFDAAAVYTIHGFCQRALGEHALLAGLELEREFLADEAELLQKVADAAWKAELASASPAWLGWLLANRQSPDVWLAALRGYLAQPGLEVATPADPHTEMLEARYRERLDALRQRWAREGEAALSWLWAQSEAGNLKGSHRKDWLAGSVAFWQDWLQSPAPPALVEDEKSPGQAEGKVRRLYGRELSAALKAPQPVPEVYALLEPLVEAALPLQQAYAARLARTLGQLVPELAGDLARLKASRAVMSFHDLLVELDAALAGEHGAALVQALRRRYQAALIDEFQDTDPLQFRIFSQLFGDGSQPAFLVGDPKQAIYAFRGAELHAYLAAREQVAPARRYSLATNRRSTPELVAAVGQLFGQAERPFLLDGLSYPPVGALDDKPRLYLDGQPQPALGWQWLGEEALGKTAARQAAVALAARQIALLLSPGRARLQGGTTDRPLAAGDIAVLAGSHAELMAMQQALAAEGVASVRISRESVFQTEEAHDLLQVLTALIEPSERAVRAAMATTCMGLDAAQLHGRLADETAWEATLADFRHWQTLLLQRGAMAALEAWLIDSGAAERMAGWQDGERRLTNLLHLFELLELARRERAGLAPLLGWYRQALSEAAGESEERLMRLESDASRVRLVTIHAAKGLEYPVVFCPFLWDGQLFRQSEQWALCYEDGRTVLDLGSPRFEARRALARTEKLAEKLRLLYVALTRPCSACYLAWGEVKDMQSAALAWLLAGGTERVRAASDLHAELADLIAAAPAGSMAWQAPPSAAQAAVQPAPAAREPKLAKLPRRLSWRWRMSSFSALVAGVHAEAPDHDASVSAPLSAYEPLQPGPYDSFPSGARAGVCLHALFENWEFTSRDRAALEALASRQLAAHGFDTAWAGMAADMVEQTVQAPLTASGAALVDVPAQHRLVELEFTYRLQPFAWRQLAALLADPAHGLPGVFAEAASGLHAEVAAGYLKGYIDLSCQIDGRHYVVDWKSNRLASYTPDTLLATMSEAHYYLQALVYCVALHRYLAWRKPGYDYERDFGGAIYLFLRGMPANGIWSYRPPRALLQGLENLLCGP